MVYKEDRYVCKMMESVDLYIQRTTICSTHHRLRFVLMSVCLSNMDSAMFYLVAD